MKMIDQKRLKKIKLVVFDLDGTLLDSHGEIGDETIELIGELEKYDVVFSFASGRLQNTLTEHAELLNIRTPLISLDGSLIKNHPDGDTIFEAYVPKKYVKKGPKFVMEDGCNSFIKKNISKTELMWINNDSRIVSLEKRKHDNAIKYLKEFLKSSKEKGIPKGLEDDFKRGFDIFVGNKKLRKSIKEATLDLISTNEKLFYSR